MAKTTSKREHDKRPKQDDATRLPGTRTLGITVDRKELLVRRVNQGFAYRQLARLEDSSGLTRERIGQFVAISTRTLARRKKAGKLHPDESDRVLRAATIFELTVDLFEGSVEQARQWLITPNTALGGASPLEYASTGIGAREVEHLIGRLEDGVFT